MDEFKKCSVEINNWINKQPFVCEKTLTDWLLHSISNKKENFSYKEIEGSSTAGCSLPWEFFILTANSNIQLRFGHKFLILPKKLSHLDNDISSKFSLAETENFITEAKRSHAYPLYLIHSNLTPDEKAQASVSPKIIKDILKVTKKQPDGCFLCPADTVKSLLKSKGGAQDFINSSFNLSLVDVLADLPPKEAYRFLSKFNVKTADGDLNTLASGAKFSGICNFEYFSSKLPSYICELFSDKQKDISSLSFITNGNRSGVSALDLTIRRAEKYKQIRPDEWRVYAKHMTFGYNF